MPRPKEGYRSAAGDIIPGTSDITKRYANARGLVIWGFQQGKKYPDASDPWEPDTARDVGTCVHMMAEMDLRGQPKEDIDHYLKTTFRDSNERNAAITAFRAYRQWRSRFHVDAHVQEVSLVSEKYQFGGTLDTIAHMRGGLGLVDFKTSKEGRVYPEHVWQLAAYGMLWEENRPDEPLNAGYHLIMLPKDGSKPIHREFSWSYLEPFREQFKLFRRAWDLEDFCTTTKALKGIEVEPSIAPERPAKVIRKPQARVEAPAYRDMSMAEILRANGHAKVFA